MAAVAPIYLNWIDFVNTRNILPERPRGCTRNPFPFWIKNCYLLNYVLYGHAPSNLPFRFLDWFYLVIFASSGCSRSTVYFLLSLFLQQIGRCTISDFLLLLLLMGWIFYCYCLLIGHWSYGSSCGCRRFVYHSFAIGRLQQIDHSCIKTCFLSCFCYCCLLSLLLTYWPLLLLHHMVAARCGRGLAKSSCSEASRLRDVTITWQPGVSASQRHYYVTACSSYF